MKIIHEFDYKGYTIVITNVKGKACAYPIHDSWDLCDLQNDIDSTPIYSTVESCIQWIDEDVKCRKEAKEREKEKELISYRITLKYRDNCNGTNGPITEKFIYSQTITRKYSNLNELFKAQMDYLTNERGYSIEDIILIDWELVK